MSDQGPLFASRMSASSLDIEQEDAAIDAREHSRAASTSRKIVLEDTPVRLPQGLSPQASAPIEPTSVEQAAPETDEKSKTAFRTISEVSTELDVPQHVLRFWESRFHQIRPLKRAGGRRYYRPDDVALLKRIKELLYKQGYTIRGVQRLMRESRGKLPEITTTPVSAVTLAAADAVPKPVITAAPAAAHPAKLAAVVASHAVSSGLSAKQRAALTEIADELRSLRTLLATDE